jgi:pyrroloquinoline quinone biosynthesis protein D
MDDRNSNLYSTPAQKGVKLAQVARLRTDSQHPATIVLVVKGSEVQLNRSAADILKLCDGSRSPRRLVAEIVRHSGGKASASDVAEYLEAARRRGWVVDNSS